ncbi:MAG: hypothetical protein K2Q22_10870, partial [Cytophagales bacterium]|nr:hypothetical protein [Cytophagales bacterium]
TSKNDRRENLYICYNVDGLWTKPVPMNEEINSNEREIFPYMPNDTCLYFSSNGLAGYGGMDGYYTQRLSLDWQSITLPYNLGPKLNSMGEETNFSASKEFDLFYSQETRSGNSTMIKQIKGVLPEYEIIGSLKTDKGKTISGKVELHDLNDYTNQLSVGTNNLGRFVFKIHQKTGIKAIAHASGYLPHIIVSSENQLQTESPLQLDFTLKKIILGQSIHLNEVSFSEDGRDLIQSSVLQLEIIAEALQQNSEIKAIVSLYAYHTDDVHENKRIMDIETKSIRNLLEAKGARMNNVLFVSHPKLPKDFQSETGYGTYVEIVFVKN